MFPSDTTRISEDNGNSSTTLHYNTNSNTVEDIESEENSYSKLLYVYICSSLVVALFIAVLVYYSTVTLCRNSDNTNRQRNERNPNIIQYRMMIGSLETVVYRPLPPPPAEIEDSALPPAVPEDDYLRPIDSVGHRQKEEIRNLPPAPPVFPRHLESLQLDGEGAYTQVINDHETPLLSPGPMHESTSDEQQCEPHEKYGYMVPRSLRQTSVQQSLSETDHPPELNEIQHMDSGNQRRERTVVTTHGAVQQCPDMSGSIPFAEGASISSATLNKTERPNETKGKIYRSTCQLYLSPATQHRNPEVSTSKPTVVVYIHTNP